AIHLIPLKVRPISLPTARKAQVLDRGFSHRQPSPHVTPNNVAIYVALTTSRFSAKDLHLEIRRNCYVGFCKTRVLCERSLPNQLCEISRKEEDGKSFPAVSLLSSLPDLRVHLGVCRVQKEAKASACFPVKRGPPHLDLQGGP